MRTASPYLVYATLDGLRYLVWVVVSGLVAVGSCFYGGYAAYAAWKKTGPPPRSKQSQEFAIHREAVHGIADIEAFLVQQPPATRSDAETDSPPTTREHPGEHPTGGRLDRRRTDPGEPA